MSDMRPQADRILVGKLSGEARHHARTAGEEAATLAALRELAGGPGRLAG